MTFIVAIDGPAGTGKSSVARMAALKLGFVYVDTGAIYRALAYVADKNKVESDDIDKILLLVPSIDVKIDDKDLCTSIFVNGQNVEKYLRSEKISRLSSMVSQHKLVRDALLRVQRDLVKKLKIGGIFEGRDIGTVVFPQAQVKIFITANSETRARRRFEQIKGERGDLSLDQVQKDIELRDNRDKNRLNSPMQKACDAKVIDTSNMSLEQVLETTIKLIKKD